jgi:hypothetical protein
MLKMSCSARDEQLQTERGDEEGYDFGQTAGQGGWVEEVKTKAG